MADFSGPDISAGRYAGLNLSTCARSPSMGQHTDTGNWSPALWGGLAYVTKVGHVRHYFLPFWGKSVPRCSDLVAFMHAPGRHGCAATADASIVARGCRGGKIQVSKVN